MVSLFSVDGLAEKQKEIQYLAEKSGFMSKYAPISAEIGAGSYMRQLGILFLSFRPEAPKIIMIISATHGVEGPTGYDLQLDLLQKKAHEKLPEDIGLIFVVALNPWGWVHGRRTDGGNVDLNRNGWFGSFPKTPPFTSEIAALVHPEECDEKWCCALTEQLADPAKCASLRAKVFRGQDANSQGIFYGGRERCWSLKHLELFLRERLSATCRQLAVLDIHTGLGERGEITLISSARPEDKALIHRVKSWFGLGPVFPKLGQTTVINAVSSDLLFFIAQCLPKTEVTALAVEIGTEPFEKSFPVFVAENYLYHHSGEIVYFDHFFSGVNYGFVRERFQEFWYPPCQSLTSISGDQWSAATRAGFGPIFRTVLRGLSE